MVFVFFSYRCLRLPPCSFSYLKTTGFLTPDMYFSRRTSGCATGSSFCSFFSVTCLTGLTLVVVGVDITLYGRAHAFVCAIFLLLFGLLSFVFTPSRTPHPFSSPDPSQCLLLFSLISRNTNLLLFSSPRFLKQTKQGPGSLYFLNGHKLMEALENLLQVPSTRAMRPRNAATRTVPKTKNPR